LGRAGAGLVEIDVWCSAICRCDVGISEHLLREVGVQIKADADELVGADFFTHHLEQSSLGVVITLAIRSAVK